MPRKFAVLLCLLLSACAVQHYDPKPLDAASSRAALAARSLDSNGLRTYIESKSAASGRPARRWDLERLTLAAFYFNPELEAARSRLAAFDAAVTTAGQAPNPTLQLPLQYAPSPNQGDSAWSLGLALDIPVETHGKRGHRVAQAGHAAQAARLELAGAAWSLRSQLREQLLGLWLNTEKASLLQQQVETDGVLAAMLDKRLDVGYASARDLSQQQLALIQSSRELAASRRELDAARIRIAGLLGVPPGALDGVELDLAEFTRTAPMPPADRLQSLALLNRADVLAAQASYESSQAALQLEVARQYPDLHLGPGYTLDQGVKKLGFDFSGIELPIFNRNEGPIAQARARRQEAAAKVMQAQARAWSELDGALSAWRLARDAQRQAGRQRALQEAQFAGVRRAFELGEDDRLSLELNRKTDLSARLLLLDAQYQAQQALGRIEDAIQRPFSAIDQPYAHP
jgi:outer membrane protein TolC